jgi:hypothetical protein
VSRATFLVLIGRSSTDHKPNHRQTESIVYSGACQLRQEEGAAGLPSAGKSLCRGGAVWVETFLQVRKMSQTYDSSRGFFPFHLDAFLAML